MQQQDGGEHDDGSAASGNGNSGINKEEFPPTVSRTSESSKSKHESRRRSETSRRPPFFLSGNRRSLSQDSPLQLSTVHSSSAPKAPALIEAAVWDWKRPSTLSDPTESSTYFYEPQGELLKERTRRVPDGGFSIPEPVGSTADPLEALLSGGVKRKAALDPEAAESLESRKRPAAGMGEDNGRQRGAGDGRTLASTTDSSSSSTSHLPLPARKVFPIQIGDKLFRLSGASISSDGK